MTRESRPGDWMDEWGACKVCGGEIPAGHTPNCDYWKLEQKLHTARQSLEWYAEKAVALTRYLSEKKTEAVMAVVTELSLDNGRRGRP